MAPSAVIRLAVVAALAFATAAAGRAAWTTISAHSPYSGCAAAGLDGLFADAEVEPSLAADPRNPRRLVASYQQDRFTNGGARGLVAATSGDGRTWVRSALPFGACAGGRTASWRRASDPWVSIGADGRAYVIAVGNGIAVSTSTDGRRWSAPVALAANGGGFLTDKPTLTADPARRGVAYAVWQRFLVPRQGPPVESDTMLSVTTDGGRRWSAARVIAAHAAGSGDVASAILVDTARRRLYHLAYRQSGGVPGPGNPSLLLAQRSGDGGRTWTSQRSIAAMRWLGGGSHDPASGDVIRPGVPSFAIDSATGALYAAWQDSRFSGGRVDQIAIARSGDGGRTWTQPRRVDAGSAIGIVPAIDADHGSVAVSYYTVGGAGSRLTLAVSTDAGRHFRRQAVGPSFALADAPLLAGDPEILVPPGLFLGDYSGLVLRGGVASAAFATANADPANRTDIRFAAVRVR